VTLPDPGRSNAAVGGGAKPSEAPKASAATGGARSEPKANEDQKAGGASAATGGARSEAKPSEVRRSWTVLDLLRWTTGHFAERGIDTARLDAECLLAHALGSDRLRLYLDFDKPVEEAERARFRELVRRRAGERVPVAQLLGRREFWSLPLRVSGDVLAPRPETETLVEAALERLPAGCEARVLDLGTGSGAVALALAAERPLARITATDISAKALELARRNAEELHMADRIRWLEGSLFEPVAGESFDLVVSNPPYVAESQRSGLPPELRHEPAQALFAGPDGTDVLRALLAGVRPHLAAGGWLAVELSPEQEPRVTGWCRDEGLLEVGRRRDLAGRVRVLTARAPQGGA
jgi:release factor glutamine methyltransferase